MLIHQILFPFFPREYGRYRRTIYDQEQMLKLAERDNGITDVYVSVYDKNLHLDKVVWDIDAKTPSLLPVALDEAKRFYKAILGQGIPVIVNFSGKKGFHVYALFRPEQMDYYTAAELIRNIQEQFVLKVKSRLTDSHLIGNPSALIRLPNTLNGSRFCVPLPEDFVNWSITKILDYALRPHDLDENFVVHRPPIKDFYNPELFYPTGKPITLNLPGRVIPENIKTFLKNLIRPCIYQLVIGLPNPPHFARVELTTELYALGYQVDEIVEIIRKLKWIDFDEKITRKYVEKYVNYIPYSCRRLKAMGVSCDNGCHWRYFWKKERLNIGPKK